MTVSCLVLSGIIGLMCMVFLPILIHCCVSCLGFKRGGINRGSYAATGMSWGGGETPCCISIGQSIGATGSIPCCFILLFGILPAIVTAYLCYKHTENGEICLNDMLEPFNITSFF